MLSSEAFAALRPPSTYSSPETTADCGHRDAKGMAAAAVHAPLARLNWSTDATGDEDTAPPATYRFPLMKPEPAHERPDTGVPDVAVTVDQLMAG